MAGFQQGTVSVWTIPIREDELQGQKRIQDKGLDYCRQGGQTKHSWLSDIMFRPGWNRKMYHCSSLSSPMLRIYFWMPLNSEKCLWNQLCRHYLLVGLDLKIKQEPTTATKNAMSSSERALHNLCEVLVLLICHHEDIHWGNETACTSKFQVVVTVNTIEK